MSSHHTNPRSLLNAATRSLIERDERAGRPPMAAMSPDRVAWMTAVARGVLRRKGAMLQRGSDVGLGQAGGSKRARTAARGGAL